MTGGLYNPRPVDDTPVNGQLTHGITSNWAFDHNADLDAHILSFMQIKRTGNYFDSWLFTNQIVEAVVADTIYTSPFIVARDLTIDRLAIQVTTGAAGGAIARLGIYNNGTNCYPGTLVLDAGTVAVDAAAVVAATINQALTKGLYWMVIVSDNTPTLRGRKPFHTPAGAIENDLRAPTSSYGGWKKAAVGSGALADPFVAAATLFKTNAEYRAHVAPRLLSLD